LIYTTVYYTIVFKKVCTVKADSSYNLFNN
jgi:hypothetical protein